MASKISVVLPVYNVEAYIEACIDSLLLQSVQDFEIIVIDDCSTDNTINLIESYKDSRIIIIEKDSNKGLIDSLNLGFEMARGTYIARMDGDDISMPNRFEKQLQVLENNPEIDVCGCWLQEFGKTNNIIRHKETHDEIVTNMLSSCAMSLGTVMIRRKAITGVKFNENKKHVEDYDFWSRIAWSCTFYNIQEVLYHYRIHDTQVSTIHKQIQLDGDVAIKLSLFKKLNYNTNVFPDELITKMLVLNKPVTLTDFGLFIKWLKKLAVINKKKNVFLHHEFKAILKRFRRTLLFSLYFKKTSIGITKQWRIKALFKLPITDVLWILNLKRREIFKLRNRK
ncbi:glycosyltransferase [Algibacter sp. 2305UL17-15]|uniref:glycosyltransferase family 2 protein n=1 Tax=Algibacter sp. 2305UL17-15 TaxID=3231268 RepID=UPI00345A414E